MNGLHISIWLVVQSDDFLCNMRKVFGLFKMLWLWCISSVFVWYMWFSFTRSYWVHHSVIKASHDWSSTGEVYPTSQYTRSCEQWTQCSNPRVSSRVVYLWKLYINLAGGFTALKGQFHVVSAWCSPAIGIILSWKPLYFLGAITKNMRYPWCLCMSQLFIDPRFHMSISMCLQISRCQQTAQNKFAFTCKHVLFNYETDHKLSTYIIWPNRMYGKWQRKGLLFIMDSIHPVRYHCS